MKLFLVSSAVPFRNHDSKGVTAVNIVAFELIQSLVRLGQQVSLQVIFNTHRRSNSLTEVETEQLKACEKAGVEIEPPIYPSQYQVDRPRGTAILRAVLEHGVFDPRIEHYYPAARIRDQIGSRIQHSQSDAVLTLWSPEGVAATHGLNIPRVAYHGDIDFEPASVRLRDSQLFSNHSGGVRNTLDFALQKRDVKRLQTVHMQLMKDIDVIANVTASNADFYARQGHLHSIYVPNTWIDAGTPVISPDRVRKRPIKIIGHVGYLNRTGSTYGMRFLLAEVMPELRKAMSGLEFDVHVIGGGALAPSLEPLARQDGVVMRGYVDDLDSEIASCDAMMLLNNAGPFQAAFTRHLVAWANGLCLIVHSNSQKAIPELVHMKNALVGSDAASIARMVRLATTDAELNRSISLGGRRTFEEHFTPNAVAGKLVQILAEAVRSKTLASTLM